MTSCVRLTACCHRGIFNLYSIYVFVKILVYLNLLVLLGLLKLLAAGVHKPLYHHKVTSALSQNCLFLL